MQWLLFFLIALYGRVYGAEEVGQEFVRLGACQLAEDPDAAGTTPYWPTLCLKPKVNSDYLVKESEQTEGYGLLSASLYSGFHLHKYFSLHSLWHRQRLYHIKKMPEHTYRDFTESEYGFVEIGNVALSRFRASIGKIETAFGVNHQPLMPVYERTMKNRRYWQGPKYGVLATMDNRTTTQIDLSYTQDKSFDSRDSGEQGPIDASLSFRFTYDIAALDGFRYVLSSYLARHGERRVGVGLVNVNPDRDVTVFEWIRVYTRPDRKDDPYLQLFRVNYASTYRDNTRYLVEYEDERFIYRMGTFGADFKIWRELIARATVSYYVDVPNRSLSHFLWGVGTQAEL